MQRELRLGDLKTLQKLVKATNEEGEKGHFECSGIRFRLLPSHRSVTIITSNWRVRCPTRYEIGNNICEYVFGDVDAFERDLMVLKLELHGRY